MSQKLSCVFLYGGIILSSLLFSCKLKSVEPLNTETEEAKFESPGAGAEWQYRMLEDKHGKIPDHIREQELAQARSILQRQKSNREMGQNIYTSQGPFNVGGRSRCVVYDLRYDGSSNQVILCGGVSGGIYKSTDDGANWVRKSPTSAVYSVTSLVQDPRPGHQDTWYYATGEAIPGNNQTLPPQSDGIYKSVDNGETWAKLPNSNTGVFEKFDRPEDLIWRLAVNPVNGDIYMAAVSSIFRSQDGGSSWQCILGSSSPELSVFASSDLIVTIDGHMYAAFSGDSPYEGVWTSTTGNVGSWTKIAGGGSATSPAGWLFQGGYGRIVLATAPSDQTIVYAFMDAKSRLCTNGPYARLFKWSRTTSTWADLSSNIPGCSNPNISLSTQGGYDMLIHVKPDNPNIVLLGGTNLFKSTDGFTSIGNTSITQGTDLIIHDDTHWVCFKPGDPNSAILATDGGLFRTADIGQTNPTWTSLNNGFTTVQYYHVAIDPADGSDKIMGGAQDNGCMRRIAGSSNYQLVFGGDGMSVGISKPINGIGYEYSSDQYSNVMRQEAGMTGPMYSKNIAPSNLPPEHSFYTLFKLDDDNTENIYYVKWTHLARNTSASTATTSNWTELTGLAPFGVGPQDISTLATTRGTYDASKSSLFIGYSYGGKILRLDNPAYVDPSTSPVDISSPSFPSSAYMSSISVNPRNDDTVMVTFSNYNTISIWWTGNANSASPTWVNVERNLTLPSVRSSAIAVTASGVEYFVGTSVGLFRSTNALTSDWTQESPDGLGNAVVSSLALRASDNRLVVGTFGNSIWSTSLTNVILPVTLTNFSGTIQDGAAQLTWSTTTELNSSGFAVERSLDGSSYSRVGFVNAFGNGNVIRNYSYLDRGLGSGNNYYRLKIIDINGDFKNSNVVLLKNASVVQNVYVVNPFNNSLQINFSKLPASKIALQLFDRSGRLIERDEQPATTQCSITFHNRLQSLTAGIYILQISVDGQTFKKKIVRK